MIFDIDKWERIKNRREDAAQAYQAASKDWEFEKYKFEKIAGVFQGNFHSGNTKFAKASEAIKILRRMDPLEISAIDVKAKETLALAETGTDHHKHLAKLLEQLIVMKRAECRRERAAEIQRNNTQCFGGLEEFARKHINLSLSSGPTPVADLPTAMDSYAEGL